VAAIIEGRIVVKKTIIILAAIATLIAVLIAATTVFFNCIHDEEAPNMSNDDPTKIIWVEEGDRPVMKDSHTVGIRYREVDLSKPNWQGKTWDERGFAFESNSDLTQILGQEIATRDEAAYVANKILESEQDAGMFPAYELMQVEHDPDKNIWIFIYWENKVGLLGSCFHVAVDGETGELLRMWVE